MRFDANFYLWAGSLCLSAAAVALFIWLMRERPRQEDASGSKPTDPSAPPPAAR